MLQSIFGISQSLGLTKPTSQPIRLPDTTSQYIGLPENISHSLGLPKKYFYFSHTLPEVNVSVIMAIVYTIYLTFEDSLCNKILMVSCLLI